MEDMNDLESLINEYTQLECRKDKEHYGQLLNLVCCDDQCNQNQKQFEALCCICQEDKVHNVNNHKTKPLKRMLKMVVDQLNTQRNDFSKIEEINIIAKEFKVLSENCEKISQNITKVVNEHVKNLNEQSNQAEIIIRSIVNSESQKKLNEKLRDLRKLIHISKDNMFLQFKNYDENQEKLNGYGIALNHILEQLEGYFNQALYISENKDKYTKIFTDQLNNRPRIVNIPEGQFIVPPCNFMGNNNSSTFINLQQSNQNEYSQKLTPQLLKKLPQNNAEFKNQQQQNQDIQSSTFNFLGSAGISNSQDTSNNLNRKL